MDIKIDSEYLLTTKLKKYENGELIKEGDVAKYVMLIVNEMKDLFDLKLTLIKSEHIGIEYDIETKCNSGAFPYVRKIIKNKE